MTAKATHTPGLWMTGTGNFEDQIFSRPVFDEEHERSDADKAFSESFICDTGGNAENARLIAAAPALLAVARAYVDLADSILIDIDDAESEWPGLPDMLEFARAALKLAEGVE